MLTLCLILPLGLIVSCGANTDKDTNKNTDTDDMNYLAIYYTYTFNDEKKTKYVRCNSSEGSLDKLSGSPQPGYEYTETSTPCSEEKAFICKGLKDVSYNITYDSYDYYYVNLGPAETGGEPSLVPFNEAINEEQFKSICEQGGGTFTSTF